MPTPELACPRRNGLGNGVRCILPPGHTGSCDFPGGLNPEPRAHHPWQVTLCWSPDQYNGLVLVYRSRPVASVWGLLAAGFHPRGVAQEMDMAEYEVRVLDLLRRELPAGRG